jgi:hypothetical protein
MPPPLINSPSPPPTIDCPPHPKLLEDSTSRDWNRHIDFPSDLRFPRPTRLLDSFPRSSPLLFNRVVYVCARMCLCGGWRRRAA